MKDSERTYSKVDDFTFKIEQDRHIEETTDLWLQLNACAKFLNAMKQSVDNAKQSQQAFKLALERYNLTVDILNEAKEKLDLNVVVPEKIEVCDDFNILDVDIAKLPLIEKIFENNKEAIEDFQKKQQRK